MKISLSEGKKGEDLGNLSSFVTIPMMKEDEKQKEVLTPDEVPSETPKKKTSKVKEAVRDVCNGLAITVCIVLAVFVFCVVYLGLFRLARTVVYSDEKLEMKTAWENYNKAVVRSVQHFNDKLHELEKKQELADEDIKKLSLMLAKAEDGLNTPASDLQNLREPGTTPAPEEIQNSDDDCVVIKTSSLINRRGEEGWTTFCN